MRYLRKFDSVPEANQWGGLGLEKPHVDIVIVGNNKVPNYVKGIKGETFNCEFDSNGKMMNAVPIFTVTLTAGQHGSVTGSPHLFIYSFNVDYR